jgi:hypothetical protein
MPKVKHFMRDRQDQSDLLAAQLATGGAGLAFLLAAIGFLFVNYGIAIGIFAGAILLFVAAQILKLSQRFNFEGLFCGEAIPNELTGRFLDYLHIVLLPFPLFFRLFLAVCSISSS